MGLPFLKRRWIFSFILTLGVLVYLELLRKGTTSGFGATFFNTAPLSPRERASNSTLGFQKLLALSTKPSWRTRGLLSAAKLTGLDFTIPSQPFFSDESVHALQNLSSFHGKKVPPYGSAKAYLAHLTLLRHVVDAGFETTFIVEDDVDWDLRLKSQIQLVSDNVRLYTAVPDDDISPYGNRWDVLWLGHCGSAIEDFIPTPLVFPDETRSKIDLYSGWSKYLLRSKLAEGHRQVQDSLVTVCSFGYGVTKQGAQRVLELLSDGGSEAFDIALSERCQFGDLKCLVVNPELFHHYEPPRGDGYVSEVKMGDGKGTAAAEVKYEGVMGTTENIVQSARCMALFHDTCMAPPSPG
ncbi:hypothetical protein BX600DRAFT_439489 [Xylariales sp. PMI_506]|nr:hypothetical protein BX600DRAFT_439489 [Xylariales sp. PMI_506]